LIDNRLSRFRNRCAGQRENVWQSARQGGRVATYSGSLDSVDNANARLFFVRRHRVRRSHHRRRSTVRPQVLEQIIAQVKAYDNLNQPVVDAFKYLNPLASDGTCCDMLSFATN
jgi:hypothetical protein